MFIQKLSHLKLDWNFDYWNIAIFLNYLTIYLKKIIQQTLLLFYLMFFNFYVHLLANNKSTKNVF